MEKIPFMLQAYSDDLLLANTEFCPFCSGRTDDENHSFPYTLDSQKCVDALADLHLEDLWQINALIDAETTFGICNTDLSRRIFAFYRERNIELEV